MANPAFLQEMLEVSNGVRGLPTIVVGAEVIKGFNRERLVEALRLKV